MTTPVQRRARSPSTPSGSGRARRVHRTSSLGADNYIVKSSSSETATTRRRSRDAAVTVVRRRHRLHDRRRLAQRDEPRLAQQLRLHREVPEERQHPGQQPLHLPQDRRGERGREPGSGYLPAGQYNWIIKSNAMGGASRQTCTTTTPKVCTATFAGKNNITAVNRTTGVAYSLGGNYNFQVDVTDNSEPGSSPAPVPTRTRSASGTPRRAPTTSSRAARRQPKIDGGNIQVRPPGLDLNWLRGGLQLMGPARTEIPARVLAARWAASRTTGGRG